MGVEPTIRYADADNLCLDPQNPRLGRPRSAPPLGQEDLLSRMSEWALEELMLSFLQSGFWPQEALVVIREELQGSEALVVVEGNRRLAALKWMRKALRGDKGVPRRILKLMADQAASGHKLEPDGALFAQVPYIVASARDDVDAYLGFRHVTGIKQWEPQEKASFIAQLIEDRGMSYAEVGTLIGSRADVVRRNYLALCILDRLDEQIGDSDAREALQKARNRFSVFFLSLREKGVQDYLGIDAHADPNTARNSPPIEKLDNSQRYLIWLFGSKAQDSLVGDSRNVTRFGRVLASPEAVEYLNTALDPTLDVAYSFSHGATEDLVAAFQEARKALRTVLADLDLKREEPEVAKAAWPVLSAAADIARRLGGETLQRMRELLTDAGGSCRVC